MRIIDTKGKSCPVPIIETSKALKESLAGETFNVITDNKTSFLNISRFLSDNGIKFSVSEENNIWTFTVTSQNGKSVTTPAEGYCEPSGTVISKGDYVVAVSSEIMGQGNDALGKKLMKSFFVALSCTEKMPLSVMFYNSGVKLTIKSSPVNEILHELEKKGVEIVICGTCVEFFKIADEIDVGRIGDMYQITQKLSLAGNVIRP